MYKYILRLSLFFTNTGLVPISPLASVIGFLNLLVKIISLGKVFKVELMLIFIFIYFVTSSLFFYPLSFFDYGFYRYDGNFIISYLPIFALAFIRPIIGIGIIKKFLLFSFWIHFIFFIYWLATKNCSFGGLCSFAGFYEARNATGGFLSIVAIISFVFLVNGFNKFKWITLLFVMMLSATMSRGSMLGFLLSAFLYYIFTTKKILLVYYFGTVLMVVSLAVSIFFYDPSQDYKHTYERDIVLQFIDSETSAKEANVLIRATYLWPKALDMFLTSPIVGHGIGSFNDYGRDVSNFQIYSSSHAHNSFLHFLAEMGLLGFGLYMLFFHLFTVFWKKYRYVNILIADMAYFSYLAVFFASFTEHRITTPASMIVVSILIGIFFSLVRFSKKYK